MVDVKNVLLLVLVGFLVAGVIGFGPFSAVLEPTGDGELLIKSSDGKTCTSKSDCERVLVPNDLTSEEFEDFWSGNEIVCDETCKIVGVDVDPASAVEGG